MEIEVADWIRDKDGLILKYEYLNEYDNFEVNFGQKGKCITFDDMEEFEDYVKNDIVSHTKNIIDLIQVGDYVNGYYVERVWEQVNYRMAIDLRGSYLGLSDDKFIKSIVTKEQFSSVEYLLKE